MISSVFYNFPGKKHLYSSTALVFALLFIIRPGIAADADLVETEQFNPEAQIQGDGWANVYDPVNNSLQVLPYVVIDDMAIYDGDITLGLASDFEPVSPPGGLIQAGVATQWLGSRWDNGIVYYDLNAHSGSTKILDAMAYIEENTSIRFEERSNQNAYVKFVTGGGCSSYIGRTGGSQSITLANGCLYRGIISHELFHALGVYHEQSRSDRDTFVMIHSENISDGFEGNFNIANNAIDIGPYDYNSIMHYGEKAFSKNGSPTITTIPSGIPIGNRSALSAGDIETMQYLYYTDLQLALTTVTEADPGNPVQASIVVTNVGDTEIGNIIAKDVKVTLPLPAQSSFDGFSSTDSWSCQQSGQTVECSIAILDRNTSTTLVLDFTAPGNLNSMQLSPMVSASNRDIQPNNNDDTVSITITNLTDLAVNMDISQTSVDVGEEVTTTIELSNPSQVNAQQVSLNLTAAAALSYIDFSGTGWNCTNTGTMTTCTLNSLATSASSQLTFRYNTISAVSSANISATVSTQNTDGDSSNNSANIVLDINNPPPPPTPSAPDTSGTSSSSGSSAVSSTGSSAVSSGGGGSISLFFFVLCTISILFGRNRSPRPIKSSDIQ